MNIKEQAQKNFDNLKSNRYPGRGIVTGLSSHGKSIFQIYWIMGRSSNSRNRIFIEEENGFVKTKAFDESKLEDPSLIIYYPLKHINRKHIVSNGDQTDTIYNAIDSGKSFENAIETRDYEPDAPNFTPRISGIVSLDDPLYTYRLSIIKTAANDESCSMRNYFNYTRGIKGFGHMISTYKSDGNPLPSFSGEPEIIAVEDTAQENLDKFWKALDEENRISLLVKEIDISTGEFQVLIKNKLLQD